MEISKKYVIRRTRTKIEQERNEEFKLFKEESINVERKKEGMNEKKRR